MKSKFEHLKDHCQNDGQFLDENEIDCFTNSVEDAMDENAKEVVIDFIKWTKIDFTDIEKSFELYLKEKQTT